MSGLDNFPALAVKIFSGVAIAKEGGTKDTGLQPNDHFFTIIHRAVTVGINEAVGKHIVPNRPLPINDELIWDNGTPFPKPCIDRIAYTVGKYEALTWLCGGLSFFVVLGLAAVWNDKASKNPFVSPLALYVSVWTCLGMRI